MGNVQPRAKRGGCGTVCGACAARQGHREIESCSEQRRVQSQQKEEKRRVKKKFSRLPDLPSGALGWDWRPTIKLNTKGRRKRKEKDGLLLKRSNDEINLADLPNVWENWFYFLNWFPLGVSIMGGEVGSRRKKFK